MGKKPQNLLLYSAVDPETMLWDYRAGHHGLKFGRVKDICKQFGVTCEKLDSGYKFSAPKLRLEKFIEKLHFSKTPYRK